MTVPLSPSFESQCNLAATKFPSYRKQANDLMINQLTGFYVRGTLTLNWLKCKSTFIHRTLHSAIETFIVYFQTL